MLDFSSFQAVTFDCYGTLIDWEQGILSALRKLGVGVDAPDQELLELFAKLESQAESGRYRAYRQVLGEVQSRMASNYGVKLPARMAGALADSLRDWPAFPDTSHSLRVLKSKYKLVVLSNIDRDLFEQTRPKLGVELDVIITAQDVGAYKPAPNHFKRALELLRVPAERILHVAQSLYHDIPPATATGMPTVWVNRRGSRAGTGATPPSTGDIKPTLEVPDLASLTQLVMKASPA